MEFLIGTMELLPLIVRARIGSNIFISVCAFVYLLVNTVVKWDFIRFLFIDTLIEFVATDRVIESFESLL